MTDTDLLGETSHTSLLGQIDCVVREIGMRERVYPRRVAREKMTVDKANRELESMRAVLRTLYWVLETHGG